MRRVVSFFVLLVLGCWSSRVYAQAVVSDSVHHRNECRLADQVLRTGHPSNLLVWARGYIRSCGRETWGRAVAAAVLRLRTSTDAEELRTVWAHLGRLHDAEMLNAALAVAGDEGASTPARVWALATLAVIVDPNGAYSPGEMTMPPAEGAALPPCISGRTPGEQVVYVGTPLGPDYRERIQTFAAELLRSAQAPAEVRGAAQCVAAAPVLGEGVLMPRSRKPES